MGLPEYDYIVAELTHEGTLCGQVVTDIVQEIGGLKASEGKIGATVFVLVNGEVVGSAHQPFPRLEGKSVSLPLEFDFEGVATTPEHPALHTLATACHDFDLLKIKGWPEFKTVMELQCKTIFGHKVCTNIPVVYTCNCETHLTVTVCHPGLAEILSDVEACLKQAVIAGVVVGLLTESVPAASAILTGYLKSCLLSKGVQRASEVTASVHMDSKSCSEWRRRT